MISDVVIVFGGSSSERLVSVASAQNVSFHLPDAECWFIAKSGAVFTVEPGTLAAHQRPFEHELAPSTPPTWPSLSAALDDPGAERKRFFLALHGGDGENGTTQKLFEAKGLAFTGSGSRASADAFDKTKTRTLAVAMGARVAEAVEIEPSGAEQLSGVLKQLLVRAPRWVLKPRADGSSHGLFHLIDPTDIEDFAQKISALHIPYLAEVFVSGRELTVGVVQSGDGLEALPVSEVRVVPGGAFDYAGKYLGKGTEELTPAPLEPAQASAAQALGLLTHRAVGCFGYSRTDMILTSEGPVLLEINTLPGMTRASFIPQQLAAAGRDVTQFIEAQLELSRERARFR